MKKYAFAIFAFCCAAAFAQEGAKPNVIFFFLDDSGWGDLSCYGNDRIRTPNFDAFAARGTQLTNFYSVSPVCSPSRVGAMTGRFPGKLGVHHAFGASDKLNLNTAKFVDPNMPTITKAFHDGGYRVGHFGKWHLNTKKTDPKPDEYGIDSNRTVNANGDNFVFPKDMPQNAVSTEYIVDAAIKFMSENKDSGKPFYMNVWTILPHGTIAPTQEQMDRVPKALAPNADKPFKSLVPISSPLQVYSSAILELDFQFGRLVDYLKKNGLYENTIIIVSSDNGPESEEIANSNYAAGGKTGVFRGNKRSIYEGGIRVAGILSWPMQMKTPRVDRTSIASTIDLFPSLAKICKLECPYGEIDGEDMSELFYGRPKQRSKPLFWGFFAAVHGHPNAKSPQLAMREGDWKLMYDIDGGRMELYNLKTDPMEVDNTAADNPNIVGQMKPKLLAFLKTLPSNEGSFKTSGLQDSKYMKILGD